MGNQAEKDNDVAGARKLRPRPSAVEVSFLEHITSLKKFVSRFISHPHDIEDIVHETFLNTYAAEIKSKIHTPRAFLFKTARNLSLKHLGKSATRLTDNMGDSDLLEVLHEIPSLEDTVESHEQFVYFCKAVRQLPLQCRRAFILRKVYGLTHKEIASHLDISVSTVEKHLANGIARCYDYMRAQGYIFETIPRGSKTIDERKKS